VEVPKKQTKIQDLAPEMAPGQFRMILSYKPQAASNKPQAPEATSNKRLTGPGLWDIIRL